MRRPSANVLLVEPDYRSKFPPLGLMRISTFHKLRGDKVSFVRGKSPWHQARHWDRVYVSSLFTYELPRTVDTVRYYSSCLDNPGANLIVGGIAATLLPGYIRDRVACRVVVGPIDRAGMLGSHSSPIASLVPDYSMLTSVAYDYRPRDSYFCRSTLGCIRKCAFCAVPKLEPRFAKLRGLRKQIGDVIEDFGERQHLVLMDNNALASPDIEEIVAEIRDSGFSRGATRNGRERTVDFNQAIDARLITPKIAALLATINLKPVRLAIDFVGMERQYRSAVELLAREGFVYFTNYVMFNFNDGPESLYHRIRVNIELSQLLGIQITSFPMRYIPIDDISRRHVSKGWHWRYLRGIQCLLNATHGVVSPNAGFINGAYGKNLDQFLEILSMPDHYIMYRQEYKNDGAQDWKRAFRRLSPTEREEFLTILARLNALRDRKPEIDGYKARYRHLLEHYYPGGRSPSRPTTD